MVAIMSVYLDRDSVATVHTQVLVTLAPTVVCAPQKIHTVVADTHVRLARIAYHAKRVVLSSGRVSHNSV